VTRAGTVDYAPDLDATLRGRGTARLTVAGGFPEITFAAGDIGDSVSYGSPASPSYGRDVVTRLRLAPNNYRIFVAGAGDQVSFTVTGAGTVDYDASLDGILFGRARPRSRSGARSPSPSTRATIGAATRTGSPASPAIPGSSSSRWRLVPNVYRIFFAGAATASPSR